MRLPARTCRTLALVLLAAAIAPARARASGYAIFEQGASAIGRAGAVTASIHDASAVFYNPANLVTLARSEAYGGVTLLQPVTSFAGWNPYPGYGVTEEMERQSFFPPAVYVAQKLGARAAWGAGINAPFGLGVEWKDPDQFTGRYIVTKADLKTVNGAVTGALAVNDSWSVAAGVNALFSRVELNSRQMAVIPGGGGAQTDVAKNKLSSDYTPGYGWTLATSFRPNAKWSLGAYYRSKVVTHVEGDAAFQQMLTGNAAFDAGVASQLPPNQRVKTVLRFPAMWSGAASWQPMEAWTVEADVNFVEWSLFRDLPIYLQTTPSRSRTIVENYDDSFQIRVGAEHRLPAFTYRFGYYFDDAAAPAESVSPLLPDAGRNGATLGLGLAFGTEKRWSLDLYELALFVRHRTTEGVNRDGFDGEYKSYVNAAGASLAYRW